jgi:choline transport protein
MIILWNPLYPPQQWHAILIVWAILIVFLSLNIFCAKKVSLIEGIILILHLAGSYVVIVPLWVMGNRGPSGAVFTAFEDNMTWGSVSLMAMVGLTGAAGVFVGVDAGAHMSEEARNASHVISRTMMWTRLRTGILGCIMAITFAFCVG